MIRQLVPVVPIAIIDAPQAGTGKSLLASAVHAVATGLAGNMLSVPTSDEEMKKLITASMIEGATVMLLDNLDGKLFHPSLASAITATIWKDRRLGFSETVTVPQLATWIVTGNNIMLGGDIPRRGYRIRLDAKSSKPWDDGRQFKHENLIGWVRENRGRIIAAGLTLCRAWYASSCPAYDVRRLGSFEEWSCTVGRILAHSDLRGFLANCDELYAEADEDGGQWEAYFHAWHEKYGEQEVAVSQIATDVLADAILRDALPDELGKFVERAGFLMHEYRIREENSFKIRLGEALKARKGRRYGAAELLLHASEDKHAKTVRWSVRPTTAGSAGSRGSVSA